MNRPAVARIVTATIAGGLAGVACSMLLGFRVLLSSESPDIPVLRLVAVYLLLGPATGAVVGLLLPIGRTQAGAWLIGAVGGAFLIASAGAALSPMFSDGPLWFAGFGAFGGGIAGIVLGDVIRKGFPSVRTTSEAQELGPPSTKP